MKINKKILLKGLLMTGALGLITIPTVATLTSCSSSDDTDDKKQPNIIIDTTKVSFDFNEFMKIQSWDTTSLNTIKLQDIVNTINETDTSLISKCFVNEDTKEFNQATESVVASINNETYRTIIIQWEINDNYRFDDTKACGLILDVKVPEPSYTFTTTLIYDPDCLLANDLRGAYVIDPKDHDNIAACHDLHIKCERVSNDSEFVDFPSGGGALWRASNVEKVTLDLGSIEHFWGMEGLPYDMKSLTINGDRVDEHSMYASTFSKSRYSNLKSLTFNTPNMQEFGYGYGGSFPKNSPIEYLKINDDNLTAINLLNLTNLKTLKFSTTKYLKTPLDFTDTTSLTDLEFDIAVDLNHIDFNKIPTLKILKVGGKNFTQMDFSNNPLLETLTIWGNSISTLDLSSNPLLKSLIIQNMNNLKTINIENTSDLKEINGLVDMNPNHDIDIYYNDSTGYDINNLKNINHFILHNETTLKTNKEI